MRNTIVTLVGAALLAGCSSSETPADIDAHAREYVTLGLGYAEVEPDALDFYFGPEELLANGADLARDRAAIRGDLQALLTQLEEGPETDRGTHLHARVAELLAIMDASDGADETSFAEQAQQLYGITLTAADAAALQATRDRLDALLPGEGALARRADAYTASFIIPEDRREAVFMRALDECRQRTKVHWALPDGETLDVEWTGKVPAAWHEYRGDGHSVLQVNPAAVADIGSALDIACHEAWPGHHTQFLIAQPSGGFALEDQLLFTRAPEQLLREGAGQYGVDLALPLAEREAFMRDELFPLAGFAPADAATFTQVHAARQALGVAIAPILADYLDGEMTGFAAEQALRREALVSSPEALIFFARQYGAYVLGYSVAREAVAACVATRAGGDDAAKWQALHAILATSDLSALEGAGCSL